MSHFRQECSCGTVIAQCRCASANKRVEVLEKACANCSSSQPRPSCHVPRAIIVTDVPAEFARMTKKLGVPPVGVSAVKVSRFTDIDMLRGLDPGGWSVHVAGFTNTKLRDQLLHVMKENGFAVPAP